MPHRLTVSCVYTKGESDQWLRELIECFVDSPYSITFSRGDRGDFGLPNARLSSYAACTTPYFTTIDPDDHVDPTWYTQAMDMLDADPELAFVGAMEAPMTEDGRVISIKKQLPITSLDDYLSRVLVLHNPAVYRTSYIQALIPALRSKEFTHVEMPLKALLIAKYPFVHLDRVVYWWRQHGDQLHNVNKPPVNARSVWWIKSPEGRQWINETMGIV